MELPAIPENVREVFNNYPAPVRQELLKLRQTIFKIASATEPVGTLEETLKWGQISYLPSETKSGTTIRIDAVEEYPEMLAVYLHCQTSLIDNFREKYAEILEFEGNRCIRFNPHSKRSRKAIENCLKDALTYHTK